DEHRQQIKELEDTAAVRALFARYVRTLTVYLELNSGGVKGLRDLSLQVGIPQYGSVLEPQVSDLAQAFRDQVPVAEGKPGCDLGALPVGQASGNAAAFSLLRSDELSGVFLADTQFPMLDLTNGFFGCFQGFFCQVDVFFVGFLFGHVVLPVSRRAGQTAYSAPNLARR
ncbi:hypothetical protein HGA89_05440, partial [bacterium]|nr:hypothetical protein [bacterium]